jgi:hypothetical protein
VTTDERDFWDAVFLNWLDGFTSKAGQLDPKTPLILIAAAAADCALAERRKRTDGPATNPHIANNEEAMEAGK